MTPAVKQHEPWFHAFSATANYNRAMELELAGTYLAALVSVPRIPAGAVPEGIACARSHAYLLTVRRDAWQQFTRSLYAVPESHPLPGDVLLEQIEPAARSDAFSHAAVTEWLRANGSDPEATAATVEDIVAELRGLYDGHLSFWQGRA